MANSILESLFDYFDHCPLMANNRLNIDYLPENTGQAGVEYAIGLPPSDEVLQRYKDGGAHCKLPFHIDSVNKYGADALQNMANAGFFDALSAWIRQQTKAKVFPSLPVGFTARTMRSIGAGYLFEPGARTGKYQIQCEIEYYRTGDI